MPLSVAQISQLNPWWTADAPLDQLDPHLQALRERPVQLQTTILYGLDSNLSGIHVLRGLRQVGKTTALKLLAERAVRTGRPRKRVIYLTFDLLAGAGPDDMYDTVIEAKKLTSDEEGPLLLLLDEVTEVKNWQYAVKALWDAGIIREDTLICTGSSAADLRRGAVERLPGRRGEGVDHLVLPASFGEFASLVNERIPKSPELALEQLASSAGAAELESARLFFDEIDQAFSKYLLFGGLPAAVGEARSRGEPSVNLIQIMADTVTKEVGKKTPLASVTYPLLERVLRSLGSRTSWSRLARELGAPLNPAHGRSSTPSHHTVREYMEFLASAFFVVIVYFWRSDSDSHDLSRDKKIYFSDPLIHTVARQHAAGLAEDRPALVENAVAIALSHQYVNSYEHRFDFNLPERLHVWGTKSAGEIDFVCGDRDEPIVVEVAYREHVRLNKAAGMARAFPGRPAVLVTKNDLGTEKGFVKIPASLLSWALAPASNVG